jgi:hypothetical protein
VVGLEQMKEFIEEKVRIASDKLQEILDVIAVEMAMAAMLDGGSGDNVAGGASEFQGVIKSVFRETTA